MIGSRDGWVEVPYVETPAGIERIREGILRFESERLGEIAVVPGVCHREADGTADVMRGEETQVMGMLETLEGNEGDAVICLPGTHSKWIECRDRRIVRFRTWVTGEAFELLGRSPLLAKGRNVDPDSDAFSRGLDLAREAGGGLLHQLFLGRTEMLMDRVAAEDLPSLVSGVLIGAELMEAETWAGGQFRRVMLPGDETPLLAAYRRAMG